MRGMLLTPCVEWILCNVISDKVGMSVRLCEREVGG